MRDHEVRTCDLCQRSSGGRSRYLCLRCAGSLGLVGTERERSESKAKKKAKAERRQKARAS